MAQYRQIRAERLRGLGRWLDRNGEAIFDTRPWTRAEGASADGIPVRFTARDDTLFATLLGDAKAEPDPYRKPGSASGRPASGCLGKKRR